MKKKLSALRLAPPLLRALIAGRAPAQVIIQITDHCNASCAQCAMRVANRFARKRLAPEKIRTLLSAMAQKGVTAVSLTGGEPLLFLDDVVGLARFARAAGILHVRTGTNGFLFRGADRPDFSERMNRLAEKLVAAGLSAFWISLDSADPALHEANRGLPGVVAGIEKALPIFHAQGLYPAANLGINRLTGGPGAPPPPSAARPLDPEGFSAHFRTAFDRFYAFVERLGFTTVNACYPMSHCGEKDDQAVYGATASDDVIRFTAAEKVLLFRALAETIPAWRGRLRIFTPRTSLLALARQAEGETKAGHACRGGIDNFFVDCRGGRTYPCGYRGGEDLGDFADLDLTALPAEASCRQCDWECFRDPAALFGPLLDARRRPLDLARRFFRDPAASLPWWSDIAYHRACGFFDAATPPDHRAMARHARTGTAPREGRPDA